MKNNLFAILFTLLIFTWGTAHGTLFTVDARLHSATLGQEPNNTPGGGLDTGIYLSAGQTIIVTANPNDLWSAGDIPRWSNADGLTYDLKATLGDESGKAPGTLIGQDWGLLTQSGLAAPFGALVGEVGGTFFLLGTNFSGPVPATGKLNLFFWDKNNDDNTDNIIVNVVAVPESGSLILLGLGLVALAAFARQARRTEIRGQKSEVSEDTQHSALTGP